MVGETSEILSFSIQVGLYCMQGLILLSCTFFCVSALGSGLSTKAVLTLMDDEFGGGLFSVVATVMSLA